MSAVLGISAGYHDAAAALVIDGVLVAALQEERLSRVKNDPSPPLRAARACLSIGGIAAPDRVVFYENPYARIERVLVSLLRGFPRTFRQFPRAIGAQLGSKLWILDDLAEGLGVPRAKVTFVAHHEAHAASAFYASPYPRAAVLTVDGVGEEAATAIWHGTEQGLREVAHVDYPCSLGLLYAAFTAYLGFAVNEGEYKVMGLAAWGSPRRREELAKVVQLSSDGGYELDLSYFAFHTDTELGFSSKLEALLGPRRPAERPWDLETAEDRAYADVAASLQALLEDALLGLARTARERTGEDCLCLAGGVALNAVANAKIAREAGFSRVFVQPAAGDAGGALGAAILGAMQDGAPRPAPMHDAALGVAVDAGEASMLADSLGFAVKRVDDRDAEVAGRLARGEVIAFVDGRCEFGPRALGQRSILADPRAAATRERINRAVKRREPFRPFAPSALAGTELRWYDEPGDDMTRFMTTVRRAKDTTLEAVTHVDGTARLHTVEPTSRFGALLAAVERESGIPVVLNTSLNGAGEPICATAADAVAFFAAHAVDALVVEDVVVTRRPS
ncbi:MAG: hypothetical protein JNL79_28895 [Myxococcales bacterium]|nr:hypothetical protein [Myxococcales bacterium]